MDRKHSPLYLDAASTTPIHPVALTEIINFYSSTYGNPNSSHVFGQESKKRIESAREHLAELLGVLPDEIVFTSGATESVNLGIRGYYLANQNEGNHIITVKTEHSAVLSTCEFLESIGAEVSYLDVDQNGLIDMQELEDLITTKTILVCVMHVNNETGVIHDIDKIATTCAEKQVAFFSDTCQAIGHMNLNYASPNISMATVSGHKFGGPQGIGALVVKRGVTITPMMHGGNQERKNRPGTLPTSLILGLGSISEFTLNNLPQILSDYEKRARTLEADLIEKFNLDILIPQAHRAPHIIPCLTKTITASHFLESSEVSKYAVGSTGSACNSGLIEPSHVISNMLDNEKASHFVRFSHCLHH